MDTHVVQKDLTIIRGENLPQSIPTGSLIAACNRLTWLEPDLLHAVFCFIFCLENRRRVAFCKKKLNCADKPALVVLFVPEARESEIRNVEPHHELEPVSRNVGNFVNF